MAWQTINGQRVPVAVRYDLAADGSIGFKLGDYDTTQPLVIDPTLEYSSYLGSDDLDTAEDIAVDSEGNIFVIGSTESANFPVGSALQPNLKGSKDVFVAKFAPNGTQLFATYLGGDSSDTGYGITVDQAGNVYLTGLPNVVTFGQTPFPTTPGAYNTNKAGSVFVAKLNPTGSTLIYSTFFSGPGSTNAYEIEVDAGGNAYIFGVTRDSNLPLKNPAQATYGGGLGDGFVTKFNADGSDLVYSTFVGGNGDERTSIPSNGGGLALDANNNAYIAIKTTSNNLPVTANAFDKELSGTSDIMVAKLNLAGDQFIYLTYLGGSEDIGLETGGEIAVDSAGQVYITGYTDADDFPILNPLQAENTGVDAFITKLNSSDSGLIFSTFWGGRSTEYPFGIALDGKENIYVTGETSSQDFPTKNALQSEYGGGLSDVFILKINSTGNNVIYSTYLGGNQEDEGGEIVARNNGDEGQAYIVGFSTGDFPVKNAAQATYGGGRADGFVVKINDVFFDVYLPLVIK